MTRDAGRKQQARSRRRQRDGGSTRVNRGEKQGQGSAQGAAACPSLTKEVQRDERVSGGAAIGEELSQPSRDIGSQSPAHPATGGTTVDGRGRCQGKASNGRASRPSTRGTATSEQEKKSSMLGTRRPCIRSISSQSRGPRVAASCQAQNKRSCLIN